MHAAICCFVSITSFACANWLSYDPKDLSALPKFSAKWLRFPYPRPRGLLQRFSVPGWVSA